MKKKKLYAAIILLSFLVIGIKPAHAIEIDIPGDDSYYEQNGSTFTLKVDINGTINIVSNDITLDGGGFKIIPSEADSTYGIYVSGKTNVTIQNVKIEKNASGDGFGTGIHVQNCDNITLAGNNVSDCYPGSSSSGIYLSYTYESDLTGNTVSNNDYGIRLYLTYSNLDPHQGNTLTNNIATDNTYGIQLYSTYYDVLTGNTVSNNGQGINIFGAIGLTEGNVLSNNNASNNIIGIRLYQANYNTITGNTCLNNDYGIKLYDSSNNTMEGNTIDGNTNTGIWLDPSNNNTVNENDISNNARGIYIENSSNNQIYNNNFIGDTQEHAEVSSGSGNLFDLAPPVGGNYWSGWTGPGPYVIVPDPVSPVQDNSPYFEPDGWVVNEPPVADAGPDQTIECACQTLIGTQVILNGTASSDPDGDPIVSYTWTGPFDNSPITVPDSELTVTLNVCLGVHEITLVVNDGEDDSEPDTVAITVVDTTPPLITCPGDIVIEAQSPEGVPVDDEQIVTFLEGASADDDCDSNPVITPHNVPAEFFPPGDTVVEFTATDASGNSSTCQSTVTVVDTEGYLRIIPPIINREGKLQKILAVFRFPAGTAVEDIDIETPLVLYPGDSPVGIDASNQRIVTWYRCGTLRVAVFARFPKDEVTAGVPENGPAEMMLIGRFDDGTYFYGFDNVWICSWNW